MILYHYVPKGCDLSNGICSVSKLPHELLKYAPRVGSEKTKEIKAWLEKTFPGRCQSIPVLTEPVKWQENDSMLKEWLDGKELVSIDYEKLRDSGLIKVVYCKSASDKFGLNEEISKVSFDKIDFSPLPWHLCSQEKGLFFGAIRHYFLVMKDGIIPPEYLNIKQHLK